MSANEKNDNNIPRCPYLTTVHRVARKTSRVRTDYDLQYDEKHEVVEYAVGEIDKVKEVHSHADEVGLTNVFKNAIAHGENPYVKFKKDEPGVMFAIDPNATLDDLLEAQKLNSDKFDEVAKGLGVESIDLIRAINDGSLSQFLSAHKQTVADETDTKDGE